MNLRLFLILQLLMFSVAFIVSPLLTGLDELALVITLDFAVFYLSALFVGYIVKNSPVVNALAVNIVFNLLDYAVTYAVGQGNTVSIKLVTVDAVAMIVFTLLGTYAGIRSRVTTGDEDIVN